jgi:hypothetical protein
LLLSSSHRTLAPILIVKKYIITFVDEHNFDNGIEGDIHVVGTHAVLSALRRPVVSVTVLLRRNVLRLAERRRLGEDKRNVVNQRHNVITSRSN